jgi:hypothetical protein
MELDLYFSYRYNIRYLLINKLGYFRNINDITKIKQLIFFFSLKKLEDIDDVQLYNYHYLFKFFLGGKAFFNKIKKIFILGI